MKQTVRVWFWEGGEYGGICIGRVEVMCGFLNVVLLFVQMINVILLESLGPHVSLFFWKDDSI